MNVELWCESEVRRIPLVEFIRANRDGFTAGEVREIRQALQDHGEYHGGGGASVEWRLSAHQG